MDHRATAPTTKVAGPQGEGASAPPAQARLRGVGIDAGGTRLFDGVTADIPAGLTLVRGGDGRGKTTLLRLLAGGVAPDRGRVERLAPFTFWVDPRSAGADDATPARQWLAAQRAHFPDWREDVATRLCEAFALDEHLDKGLSMLSAGTRRKVGLAAAFASGAALTLLDTPLAALDARSREVVAQLLDEAAGSPQRAYVVADYELPDGIAEGRLAALIDLGD